MGTQFAMVGCLWLSTVYILRMEKEHARKIKSMANVSSFSLKRFGSVSSGPEDAMATHLGMRISQANSSLSTLAKKRVRLINILQSKKGFRMFARALVEEFAVENLLFIVEAMQFKQTVKNIWGISQLGNLSLRGTLFEDILSIAWLPMHPIFKKTNNSKKIFLCAEYVNEKYIPNDSSLAINISHETRVTIGKAMESIKGLEDIDPCKQEKIAGIYPPFFI